MWRESDFDNCANTREFPKSSTLNLLVRRPHSSALLGVPGISIHSYRVSLVEHRKPDKRIASPHLALVAHCRIVRPDSSKSKLQVGLEAKSERRFSDEVQISNCRFPLSLNTTDIRKDALDLPTASAHAVYSRRSGPQGSGWYHCFNRDVKIKGYQKRPHLEFCISTT